MRDAPISDPKPAPKPPRIRTQTRRAEYRETRRRMWIAQCGFCTSCGRPVAFEDCCRPKMFCGKVVCRPCHTDAQMEVAARCGWQAVLTQAIRELVAEREAAQSSGKAPYAAKRSAYR